MATELRVRDIGYFPRAETVIETKINTLLSAISAEATVSSIDNVDVEIANSRIFAFVTVTTI